MDRMARNVCQIFKSVFNVSFERKGGCKELKIYRGIHFNPNIEVFSGGMLDR